MAEDKGKFVPAKDLESATYSCGCCMKETVVKNEYGAFTDGVSPDRCGTCGQDAFYSLKGVTIRAKPEAAEEQPPQPTVKCLDCHYYKPLTGINGLCTRPQNEVENPEPIPVDPRVDRVCFWFVPADGKNGNWIMVLLQARMAAQQSYDIATEINDMIMARGLHDVTQSLDEAIGSWQAVIDHLQAMSTQDML